MIYLLVIDNGLSMRSGGLDALTYLNAHCLLIALLLIFSLLPPRHKGDVMASLFLF
jgi:hypothetical protein